MILLRFSFENEGSFSLFWHLATLSIEGLTFKTADRHGRNTDVGFSCLKTLPKFWIFFIFFSFLCVHFLFLSLSFRTYTSRDFFFFNFYFILFIKEFSNKQFSTFYSGVAFGHKKKSRWCGCNDITLNWDRKLIDHWMR